MTSHCELTLVWLLASAGNIKGQLGVNDYESRLVPSLCVFKSCSTDSDSVSAAPSTAFKAQRVACGWQFTCLVTGQFARGV